MTMHPPFSTKLLPATPKADRLDRSHEAARCDPFAKCRNSVCRSSVAMSKHAMSRKVGKTSFSAHL